MCFIYPCSFSEIVFPKRFWYFYKLSKLVFMVSIAYSCKDKCESITHLFIYVLAIDL